MIWNIPPNGESFASHVIWILLIILTTPLPSLCVQGSGQSRTCMFVSLTLWLNRWGACIKLQVQRMKLCMSSGGVCLNVTPSSNCTPTPYFAPLHASVWDPQLQHSTAQPVWQMTCLTCGIHLQAPKKQRTYVSSYFCTIASKWGMGRCVCVYLFFNMCVLDCVHIKRERCSVTVRERQWCMPAQFLRTLTLISSMWNRTNYPWVC